MARAMFRRGFVRKSSLTPAIFAALAASPAAAHHVADGKTPTGWIDGLLSGLAHPVIGVDHLVFIVVVGLVAAFMQNGLRIMAAFASALLVGVLLHVARPALPMIEVLVAASVLLAGLVLILQQTNSERLWTMFAAAAGLLHGYALGEPIAGASTAAVSAYLAGLAVAQLLIMLPVKTFAELMLVEDRAEALKVQAAGGAITAIGMFFVASAISGA
jgi:urease accessory protein